jgi:hypothetical protein
MRPLRVALAPASPALLVSLALSACARDPAGVPEPPEQVARAAAPVSWGSVGSLATARSDVGLVVRADGRVALIGGMIANGSAISTSELYDPATRAWSAGPSMAIARRGVRVATLKSGASLLIGEATPRERGAELYDPTVGAAGSLAAAGTYSTVRFQGALAPLPDGGALLVGGQDTTNTTLATAERWSAPSTWSPVASMSTARVGALAVALADGRVLVVGGYGATGAAVSSAEIFDPAKGTWKSAGALSTPRLRATATRLADGRVIVVGGAVTGTSTTYLSTTELFDPKTDSWAAGPSMATKHAAHATTLLPSGRLVVAGGETTTVLRAVELLDPAATAFTVGPPLLVGRTEAVVAPLPSGGALIAAGVVGDVPAATSEWMAKDLGEACGGAAECASGHCVDGVCCDTVCDGQCEACDFPGAPGVCSPVKGAPHGAARSACTDGAGNACAAKTCDGAIDRRTCAAFVHGTETICKAASCDAAGFLGASTCDGRGACAAPPAIQCAPFACATGGCKATCEGDTDCVGGAECHGGSCIVVTFVCSDDGLASVPKGQSAKLCSPYRCGTDGKCMTTCASSADCAPGATCDPSAKVCAATTAPASGGDGGCGVSAGAGDGRGAGVVALGALMTLLGVGLARRRARGAEGGRR